MKAYEKAVSEEIRKTPRDISIDLASLSAFVRESKVMNEIDQKIASAWKMELVPATPLVIESHLLKLEFLEIQTLGDLEKRLQENSERAVQFAKSVSVDKGILYAGISIHYMSYVLVAKVGDPKLIIKYLDAARIEQPERRAEIADRILQIYRSFSSK